MTTRPAVLRTEAEPWPCRRGKVRDVYDLGDRLVLVATDRISAFDWVLPTGIPDKGRILTQLSVFWFRHLGSAHHVISSDIADMPAPFRDHPEIFLGRSLLTIKTNVVPIECVARGYLAGSAWKEYRESGAACGQVLPAGLVESARLPTPLFTPATKADIGHDENISPAELADRVGRELAAALRERTLRIYQQAADHALARGLILADTKLEFGHAPNGDLILIDEVLTPDSSRYWPIDGYRPGSAPPSFDKQYVRDWLESVGYDKQSPPPPLPDDVVERTRAKYIEAYERITSQPFV